MVLPKAQIWVHHTGSSGGWTSPLSERMVMRSIQNFHMDGRGWADIAYSFVIFPSGIVYEARGWGVVGAHTKGHNSTSHAICFAGNFQTDTPTDAAIHAAQVLIREGIEEGAVTRPFKLGGHRDVGATACPGSNLYLKLGELHLAPEPQEGSMPDRIRINAPIVGVAANPHGEGLWLVSADGGIFAHGGAPAVQPLVEYTPPTGQTWLPKI